MSTSKWSRIRYKDLKPVLSELRQEGTAWMPHSIKIERSGIYAFRAPCAEFEPVTVTYALLPFQHTA